MLRLFESWTEAALLLGLLVFFSFWRRRSHLNLPPGPRAYPVIGNLHQLSPQFYRDFQKLGKQYGPIMYLKMGAVPVVVVQSADLAREITKAQDHLFAYRPQGLLGVQILFFGGNDIGFSPIGPHWRLMRKLMTTELFLPKRLNTFREQRQEELKAMMVAMIEKSQEEGIVNVEEQIKAFMYNVVTRMVAGKTFYGSKAASSEKMEAFRALVKDFFGVFNGFHIVDWFPYMRVFGDFQGHERAMRKVAARMDAFLQGCIDDHRSTQKEPGDQKAGGSLKVKQTEDFVDVLLQLVGENGEEWGDRNIKILLQTSFIAGTDTISTALEWALAELIHQPELMKKVQDEVDSVVGRGRLVREEDLQHFTLLEAVIKETLRLHPPGPFLLPRQPKQNCKVGGYDIPSNARVLVSVYGIGRDPDAWERPLEFIPQRFLDNPRDYNGLLHEYLPFGSGRRICPAINLVLPMLRLPLATWVHLCDYSLPAGQRPEDMDMIEAPGLNLPKAVPLQVRATPRLPPDFYKTHLNLRQTYSG